MFFLNKKYILANELCDAMQINIANISGLRKEFEHEDDYTTILKRSGSIFVNTKSEKIPNNLTQGIRKFRDKFTDVSNIAPPSWLKLEYDISSTDLLHPFFGAEEISISGKRFFRFSDDFVKLTKNKVLLMTTLDDVREHRTLIDDYVQIRKNRALMWYTIHE